MARVVWRACRLEKLKTDMITAGIGITQSMGWEHCKALRKPTVMFELTHIILTDETHGMLGLRIH